jgi:hypothetical protein
MYHKTTEKTFGECPIYYYDPITELWIWKSDASYYMSALIGLPVSVDTATDIYPLGFLYNSKDYYYDSTTELYLWYSGSAYILSRTLGYGTTTSDPWWSCATLTGEYVAQPQSSEYAWTGDVVTVTFVKHGKKAGDSIDVVFDTGDGTPDGTYTIATASADSYTFALAGSGTGGVCTVDGGGEKQVAEGQLDARVNTSSPQTVTGVYEPVVGSTFENQVWVGWKILENTQSGTYTWIADVVTITSAGHGKTAGDEVYIEFTSGAGTPDGKYTVVEATNANVFTIALAGSGTGGNCTVTDEFVQNEDLYSSLETYSGSRVIWWHSASSKYIISDAIGTCETLTGYWSCSTLEGTYARTYTGTGTAPDPAIYEISLKEYREKSNNVDTDTVEAYIGPIALWL